MKKELALLTRNKAIDMLATQPSMKIKDVAAELGISPKTIYAWNTDPNLKPELSIRGGDKVGRRGSAAESKKFNKELSKKPQKFYSKSTVVFNGEVEVESSPSTLTREQVREANEDKYYAPKKIKIPQNIQQEVQGVGYQSIGNNNKIG